MKNMYPKQNRLSTPSLLQKKSGGTWSALILAASVGLGALAVGCGDGEDDGNGGDGDGDSSLGDGDLDLGDQGGDGDGDGDFGGKDEDGNCRGLDVGEGCAGEVYEGEAVPLDLYLMFDQSGSMATKVGDGMGTMRIDIVRQAVETFLRDDDSIGMGAGIGYFGYHPLPEEGEEGTTSCDPADYAEPSVEIGSLPGQEAALLASLGDIEPTGETPTGAAIRGACQYVAEYKDGGGAGRNPAILLVTDGEPKAPLTDSCSPTLDDAVQAAEQCYAEEGIRIYVLGVGPSLSNLDVIAEAGGTDGAFLADLDNADQVLEAFRAVRFAAQLPCELPLNEEAIASDMVDLSKSTVAYLDFECSYMPIPEVSSESECGDAEGWYFDDPELPTTIHLCDVTCGDVKSMGRQLFYSIGCPLQVVR